MEIHYRALERAVSQCRMQDWVGPYSIGLAIRQIIVFLSFPVVPADANRDSFYASPPNFASRQFCLCSLVNYNLRNIINSNNRWLLSSRKIHFLRNFHAPPRQQESRCIFWHLATIRVEIRIRVVDSTVKRSWYVFWYECKQKPKCKCYDGP